MTENERTVINFRGYCLFCLGRSNKENSDSQQSPFSTPSASPLSTPLRARYRHIHSLPLEDRIAPFTDLCRYLGVDISDCYAFGDGSEPEMLTPPLCEKCHDLSARLCLLQDELQYLQVRIRNTARRILQRVAATCDQRRGALRRESFQKEFKRKSKGSLSRGRAESVEMKKVTSLLKTFQMKVMEKGYENMESEKIPNTTFNSSQYINSEPPVEMSVPIQLEIVDVDQEESDPNGGGEEAKENDIDIEVKDEEEDRYLPLEETLRSVIVRDSDIMNKEHELALMDTDHVNSKITKPESELTTLICTSFNGEEDTGDDETMDVAIIAEKNFQIADKADANFNSKQTPSPRVMTRAQARNGKLGISKIKDQRYIDAANHKRRRRMRK